MIKPTIGRVVWFYPQGAKQILNNIQPHAAMIAYVHSDTMITIGYFNSYGVACSQTSVRLIQEEQDFPECPFCSWIPYQKGQAAKTEALEKKLGL